MNMNETTEQCAIRELEEETGLQLSKIQQIGAYSKGVAKMRKHLNLTKSDTKKVLI